jgi:hypothetical protein
MLSRYVKSLEIIRRLEGQSASSTCFSDEYPDPDRVLSGPYRDPDDEAIYNISSLPGFGSWEDADFSSTAVEARDKTLLQYFAGCAATLCARKIRRFIVVDQKHTNKTEQHSCHIWFRDPERFCQAEKGVVEGQKDCGL